MNHCPHCNLTTESCRLLRCPKKKRPRHKHWLQRLLDLAR